MCRFFKLKIKGIINVQFFFKLYRASFLAIVIGVSGDAINLIIVKKISSYTGVVVQEILIYMTLVDRSLLEDLGLTGCHLLEGRNDLN